MKLIHLSDLHLGKKVNEFSMIEDQEYILTKIINIIDDENDTADSLTILISGDVYDKPFPPTEAVELFDDFLFKLSKRNLNVFIISGNHDSPERLSFANRLIEKSGVYLAPVYNGNVTPVVLNDRYGEICFYMLPFIKPAHVRRFFPDEEIPTCNDAIRVAVEAMNLDTSKRNVLLSHQFVTGAELSDSEEIYIGGTDNVDAAVFEKFDYVALGHIHKPQKVGYEHIRYSGTPLKYSFSEAKHKKTVTVAELCEKGKLNIKSIPLQPKRDMKELKGTYSELTAKSFYDNTTYREDYIHITLTDEEDILDAIGKLRTIYRNLMKLDYDNRRTRENREISGTNAVESKTPLQLLQDFYLEQNNSEMSVIQSEFAQKLIDEIWK